MPLRFFNRGQDWLLPPSLDDWIPADHAARFVGAFVDALDHADWKELGIAPNGDVLGAPAYHPRVLLAVWLYGFMTGVRSSRKLEAACQDRLSFCWLTGGQQPDHNTLWRFYEAHRVALRALLKRTVRTALRLGLVDLAVQALDGTKIAASAASDRGSDVAGLTRVRERLDAAIADLEAQNRTAGATPSARLPRALRQAEVLRDRVRAAMTHLESADAGTRVNLTDPDSRVVKGRNGLLIGYNAQAVVMGLNPAVAGETGLLITTTDVVNDPTDQAQLLPMLAQAAAVVEHPEVVSLQDGGYHSGENLASCAEQGYQVLMPEAQTPTLDSPYHKDKFVYTAETDSYTCPQGQTLTYRGTLNRTGESAVRRYQGTPATCRACAAFGQCTKNKRHGRTLEISAYEKDLRAHRALMATPEAKDLYRARKYLVEPSFGILKEAQNARRFLLRGLDAVRAEWSLLATAFNLRTLFRVWQRRGRDRQSLVTTT